MRKQKSWPTLAAFALFFLAACQKPTPATLNPIIRNACQNPNQFSLAQIQQLTGSAGQLVQVDSLGGYYQFRDPQGFDYVIIVRNGKVQGLFY